ncbi:MAG: hypothetical protein O2931_14795 [Planctomycetota bacterium]|nr:hypothetical protein [Planctomycetota bacterium]MDA1180050.1 hypothetical protein [Planctomycetota bacterium]
MTLYDSLRWQKRLFAVALGCLMLYATQSLAVEPAAVAPVPGQDLSESTPSPCPAPVQLSKWFRQINTIQADISLGNRAAPPDCSAELFQSGGHGQKARYAAVTNYSWTAPEMWHQPLYFDDVPLEQYGQTKHPLMQPAISMGRFFATIPAMPYKMAKEPPFSCVSTLGKFRPGSCTPCTLQVPR